MFDHMRKNAPWDMDGNLLWEYHFYSDNLPKLKQLAAQLATDGYRTSITKDDGAHWLDAEKVETHSVDSLTLRNDQLHKLGEEFGAEYDGMDVGAAPSTN